MRIKSYDSVVLQGPLSKIYKIGCAEMFSEEKFLYMTPKSSSVQEVPLDVMM
jgi:hypothetical protein